MATFDQMESIAGVAGIDTAYDTEKVVSLQYVKFGRQQINVHASMLEVQLSNISNATKLYATLSRDAAGDNILMTETRTDLQTGITTNTKGCGLYRMDVIIRDIQDKTLYLHVRTNTGTCTVDSASLTYAC
tara:strand:+ start:120 stop:512 length:393 start_codon:yes stop_codon:yes gene_type:complete